MKTRLPIPRSAGSRVVIVCAAMALVVLAGCQSADTPVDVAEHPGPPVEPAAADLSTPESAVSSYLEWVGYAYRTADSEAASHTMTPWEAVRIDAYIELNRQQDRAIEQEIMGFEALESSVDGTGSALTAREDWRYRYITMSTGYYDGPWHEVSYDTTYTLLLDGDEWLVDKVAATPLGELQ